MLAVYDSGLGGLTVLGALRRAGITRDVVYFADQAHVPYGDRTDHEIRGYHATNFALLAEMGIELLVMGCNSSCAVASRLGFPATPYPVLDLIAIAGAAFAGTPHRRIAVVATPTTVRSGAYGAAIRAAAPSAEVIEVAAPALVPLVERGAAQSVEARDAVAQVVAQLPADVDALVYGCTHYPLLGRWFAESLPPQVVRIDPAESQAAAAAHVVRTLAPVTESGRTTYYTTGDRLAFERAVCAWTGDASAVVGELSLTPDVA